MQKRADHQYLSPNHNHSKNRNNRAVSCYLVETCEKGLATAI
ncbi:hypothetical protein HMPREF9103_00617 [Lentilactobacillus parafarraginis F0439]|uniref:Uncharacterized protein n=1 Tax=Lentilactobacillus parafarraginis F0439 TaxID=797515 RepID=G9ZLL9_9LACO|nr:hypothetical protein HMPREF9103_00617 [Lentilactobacillus parafarraginis F0439]